MPIANSGKYAKTGANGMIIQGDRDINLTVIALSDNTVTALNDNPEHIVQRAMEGLAKNKQTETVPISVIIGVLTCMGEAARELDQQTLINTLIQKGYEYRNLLEELKSFKSDNDEVNRLHEQAKRALEQGDFDNAEHLFTAARDRELETIELFEKKTQSGRISAAQNCAAAAEAARLQANPTSYQKAAQYLEQASEIVKPVSEEDWFCYRLFQTDILKQWGLEFKDYKPVELATCIYADILKETCLSKYLAGCAQESTILCDSIQDSAGKKILFELAPEFKSEIPFWAALCLHTNFIIEDSPPADDRASYSQILHGFGAALQELGMLKRDVAHLIEAVVVYKLALGTISREHSPLEFVYILCDIGTTWLELGNLEERKDYLELGIDTCQQALSKITRTLNPALWAGIMNNLGTAMSAIGGFEGSTAKLEQAIDIFRKILLEFPREQDSIRWSQAMSNLACTQLMLGSMTDNKECLEQSVETCREVLLERTRNNAPLKWAEVMSNLACSLQNLGRVLGSKDYLEQSIEASREALLERTRDRAPKRWALTMNSLANALQDIGGIDKNSEVLKEAVEIYRQALSEQLQDQNSLDWAITMSNLAEAMRILGTLEINKDMLKESVRLSRQVLHKFTRDRTPLKWASTMLTLANAIQDIGNMENNKDCLLEAIDIYKQALQESTSYCLPTQLRHKLEYRLNDTLQLLKSFDNQLVADKKLQPNNQ